MDHPNIVRLLGYCKDESEHLLVYEYMPNRSFDRFLFTGKLYLDLSVSISILFLKGLVIAIK
ncbi:putative protein kinase RLK-Pelle-RLCK-VIIa-2 family [Helianthus anomalus]